jgi:hypothetical protein
LYQVAGGQLVLQAKYNAGGYNDPVTNGLVGTISGIPIPGGISDTAITNLLDSFAAPYTSGLF